MSDVNEEDVSYLDIPSAKTEEKVWCKIGEAGNLEFVDWKIIKGMAEDFDLKRPQDRTEQMLIAKLMWLVREETKREFGNEDKAG
jgi:hypothetical protein